jgi:hypothetical protein
MVRIFGNDTVPHGERSRGCRQFVECGKADIQKVRYHVGFPFRQTIYINQNQQSMNFTHEKYKRTSLVVNELSYRMQSLVSEIHSKIQEVSCQFQ